jgi:hypothetical protein
MTTNTFSSSSTTTATSSNRLGPTGRDDEVEMTPQEERAVRESRRREKRKLRNERAEWWSNKLHAFLWVISAVIALIVSDFVNVCIQNEAINRWAFAIGGILFILVTLAILRMALSFPKSTEGGTTTTDSSDFERTHPNFVLATTFGGIFCFIFLTIGLWPVYRIFTPFLLGLFWFGMIMSLHFLP